MTRDRLLALLEEVGGPLDAQAVADVVWLAGRLPARPLESARGPAGGTVGGTVGGSAGSRARIVPAARPGALAGAFRPLARGAASRSTDMVLDEEATARASAERQVLSPVLRPAEREARLNAVLVVDGGASMVVWEPWISEVTRLLQRSAGFRDVRVKRLDTDRLTPGGHAGAVRLATGAGAVRLATGAGAGAPGSRVVLVLSDCVGRAWHNGEMARVLARWGRGGPVAVVQPLTERLWHRCGPELVRVRFSARAAGAANDRLRVTAASGGRVPPGVPVPVIRLEPDWITWWVRLVTGRTQAGRAGVALFTEALYRPPRIFLEMPGDVGEKVGRFRAAASPAAFRLAVRLSAVPLTLDVMRMVVAETAGAGEQQLAEVLLGWLLRRAPDPGDGAGAGDGRAYDFVGGVRAELRGYLSAEEAAHLERRAAAHVRARTDRGSE